MFLFETIIEFQSKVYFIKVVYTELLMWNTIQEVLHKGLTKILFIDFLATLSYTKWLINIEMLNKKSKSSMNILYHLNKIAYGIISLQHCSDYRIPNYIEEIFVSEHTKFFYRPVWYSDVGHQPKIPNLNSRQTNLKENYQVWVECEKQRENWINYKPLFEKERNGRTFNLVDLSFYMWIKFSGKECGEVNCFYFRNHCH